MTLSIKTAITPTPFGLFSVEENASAELIRCSLHTPERLEHFLAQDSVHLHEVEQSQLHAYVQELKQRSLKVIGTEFQKRVWNALKEIPFGETISYGEIAHRIGRPKAVRAVGTAVGRNEHSVLIPCHRVIQKNGTIGGFRWGVERKIELLKWERSLLD